MSAPINHGVRSLAYSALLLAVFALGAERSLPAQQDERSVRAAYVFNLTRYVSWPQPRTRLLIGVVGSGETGPVLKQLLDGKMSDGRRIAVTLHPAEPELHRCDVVYLSDPAAYDTRLLLRRLNSQGTLTVGETDGFVRSGGMVGLVRSGDQMQVEVDLAALHAAALDMSSRLLRLAILISTAKDKP